MGAPSGGGTSAPLPEISQAEIEHAKIRWKNGVTGKTRTFEVDKLTLAPSDAVGNLAVAFDGKVDSVPVNLKGITGTLANFTRGPLPINATGQIAGGDLAVKGEVADPAAVKGIALEVTLNGKAASDLGALFGATLPPLGVYQLRTKVGNPDGKFVFDGLAGKVGNTDFTGRIELDPATTPRHDRCRTGLEPSRSRRLRREARHQETHGAERRQGLLRRALGLHRAAGGQRPVPPQRPARDPGGHHARQPGRRGHIAGRRTQGHQPDGGPR